MKTSIIITYFALLLTSCQNEPAIWEGAELSQSRDQLRVEQLLEETSFPLIDMSYFAAPEWSQVAIHQFSGSISFDDTELIFPIDRAYYSGENIFPGLTLDFISNEEELIPVRNEFQLDSLSGKSLWNVLVGTGKVWQEAGDSGWSRASFQLSNSLWNCSSERIIIKSIIQNMIFFDLV